jgi:lysozyme
VARYDKLEKQLDDHEGRKKKVYRCSAGYLTIGVGRNLEDRGLSDDEITYLLKNDVKTEVDALTRNLTFFSSLNEARQDAFINLSFNMGIKRLLGFKKTIALAAQGKWSECADELLDSKWARSDVAPWRSLEISEQIRTGIYKT